jgi:hypothetical protein
MIRRRMTVKRVDPWSVLKLGLFLNIAGGAIMLLTGVIVWSVIRRLQMVERSCEQIQNIFGLEQCAVEGATVFRGGFLMIALFVIVATAVLVFSAFLYNLIADLTGGVEISAVDHTAPAVNARAAGGGVEVAPELQQTRTSRGSPVVVGVSGRSSEDVAIPPDAVDRRTREPSRLKKAAQVASTRLTDFTRQASNTLSEATKPEATSRAQRTEAATQSLDAVRLERPTAPSKNGETQAMPRPQPDVESVRSASSPRAPRAPRPASPPRPSSSQQHSEEPTSTGQRSSAPRGS